MLTLRGIITLIVLIVLFALAVDVYKRQRHTHFQNGCATGALAKIHFRHSRLTHGLYFCSFLYKIKFNYSAAKHEAVAQG